MPLKTVKPSESSNKECEHKLIDNVMKPNLDQFQNINNTVYEDTTNTIIKYRIIHPYDMELTLKNEFIIKDPENSKGGKKRKKVHNDKIKPLEESEKIEVCQESSQTEETTNSVNNEKRSRTYQQIVLDADTEKAVKVTRSGRRVKLPKRESEVKPKKQKPQTFVDVLTCLQCEKKFYGSAKLKRHFAKYPTHNPNNTHTNLFLCFLDIMKEAPAHEAGDIFVEQLQELILRIKNMLPCMINNMECDDSHLCFINKDLGRMLEMEPGKYNISFEEALNCFKNKDDKCKHLIKVGSMNAMNSDLAIEPEQEWVTKPNDDMAVLKTEYSDCARTHSVDKWPLIKKRVQKFLPAKLVPQKNKPSPNVDIISIFKEESPAETELQNAQVWVLPQESTDVTSKLYKVPATIQIPVLKLDRQQTEQLKGNVMSIKAPANKENTQLNEITKDISQKLPQFEEVDQFKSCFTIPATSSTAEIIQTGKDEVLSTFDQYQSPKYNIIAAAQQIAQPTEKEDLPHFEYQSELNLEPATKDSLQCVKNKEILHFDQFETSQFNIQSKEVSKPQKQLSHFDQYQSSRFNIKSSPIKSTNTTFNKIQIKDNVPMFVQLTKEDSLNGDLENTSSLSTSGDAANLQLDINSIFSELSEDLNKKQSDTMNISDSSNEFYNSNQQSTNNLSKDFTMTSPATSTICGMSHHANNLLHNSYVVSNSPAHRTPSDQLLSSDCNRVNATLVSSQNCVNVNQNNFTNSRLNQNDCLLSSGSNEMSTNDRLLSSGNMEMAQNDQLLSSNQNDSLSNLCGNESNLDSSRMSLPLLDQLTTDCLSFTDTELRGSSLDLPLDLFPFNHAE